MSKKRGMDIRRLSTKMTSCVTKDADKIQSTHLPLQVISNTVLTTENKKKAIQQSSIDYFNFGLREKQINDNGFLSSDIGFGLGSSRCHGVYDTATPHQIGGKAILPQSCQQRRGRDSHLPRFQRSRGLQ